LLHDHGLVQYGLKIIDAFDVDDKVIGNEVNDVKVHHVDEFKTRENKTVKIGILTVPAEYAQEVALMMIDNGIRAIWNFTPVRISVPDHVVVQNTSLYAHLAVMFNRLNVLTEEGQ
ncbi:MAG TPA: redox-sensing transcriptional repressor Rex, partial [Marinilabiliaceae bacterium]|nr:redox-sensing transcriptional repressor Rex [Marinilabiliaceae bacterium]